MIKVTVFQDGESMGTGAYHIDSILLGSAESADLHVAEEGVAEEHCEIVVIDGKLYVRPVESAPVWVDGKQVQTCELQPESRLKIAGDIEFAATYKRPTTSGRFERVGAVSFRNVPALNTTDAPPEPEPEPPESGSEAAPATPPAVNLGVPPEVLEARLKKQHAADQWRVILLTAAVSVALTIVIGVVYFGFIQD